MVISHSKKILELKIDVGVPFKQRDFKEEDASFHIMKKNQKFDSPKPQHLTAFATSL